MAPDRTTFSTAQTHRATTNAAAVFAPCHSLLGEERMFVATAPQILPAVEVRLPPISEVVPRRNMPPRQPRLARASAHRGRPRARTFGSGSGQPNRSLRCTWRRVRCGKEDQGPQTIHHCRHLGTVARCGRCPGRRAGAHRCAGSSGAHHDGTWNTPKALGGRWVQRARLRGLGSQAIAETRSRSDPAKRRHQRVQDPAQAMGGRANIRLVGEASAIGSGLREDGVQFSGLDRHPTNPNHASETRLISQAVTFQTMSNR